MNRSEFIIATAIVLFVAFLLGWFAYWLLHRFSRSAGADMNEVERMSRELHEAEEVRDQAIAYYQARETELINRLHQTEAELQAAMDGLRDARAEAEGLKDYVERVNEPSSFATSRKTLELTEAEHVDGPDAAFVEREQVYDEVAPEPEPEVEPQVEPEAEVQPEPEAEPEATPDEQVAEVEPEPETAAETEAETVEEATDEDAAPKRKRRKSKVADDA